MTARGSGSRQRDILAVLVEHGPTLSGPEIYRLVAQRNGRGEPSDSFKKQLRKSLDAMCQNDKKRGSPAAITKDREGGTNLYTLIVHSLSHEQISDEDRRLAAEYKKTAPISLLDDDDSAKKKFLAAVAVQTWKRVKCQAGESVDATMPASDLAPYIIMRTGMSPQDLRAYIRAEAVRIVRSEPWKPLRFVR